MQNNKPTFASVDCILIIFMDYMEFYAKIVEMKPILKKSLESPTGSYVVRELIEPYFDPNWHFHPHYQLFTVVEGTGTRFIGDDIRPFEAGDTVFLGPNIPHLWRSDRIYFDSAFPLKTHGIVVYFTEDFLGKEFFEKTEMHLLKQLLENAHRGLQLEDHLKKRVQQVLQELIWTQSFDGILKLLSLLNELAHSVDYQFITSLGYQNTYKISETERMQKVHEYVMKHFREEIRLDEVASLVGMSSAAFCRYFKTRTNKTLSEFVSEIRIGHACKLLVEGQLSVNQIGYDCGFNTISNFNKQFKNLTHKTPVQYQREYR